MSSEPVAADTPAARVQAATVGKPKHAYARVLASDVVALSKSVPDDKTTAITLALAQGAANAISERPAANRPDEIEVFQVAGQLVELLGAAGVS